MQAHEQLYERKYLRTVKAFNGAGDLCASLARLGHPLALASTCKAKELVYYDSLLDVVRLCTAVACGSDVKRGKPHPDLFDAVLRTLPRPGTIAVGDTPHDAIAARSCGIVPIGVLTGGFSASDLLAAGCVRVGRDLHSALQASILPV